MMEKKGVNVPFTIMKRTLSRISFFHHMKHEKRFLKETPQIVVDRYNYLRKIGSYREDGYQVMYLGETWINSNHTCPGEWLDPLVSCGQNAKNVDILYRVEKEVD